MEQLIELMRLDEPCPNGTIYPTAVVAKGVKDIEDRIALTNGVLGECNPPAAKAGSVEITKRFTRIDMARVSHIVQHVWIDNKTLMCKIKLLGKYAEISHHMDITFGGIPRSTGLLEGDNSNVCTEYSMITVDLALPELE